MIFQLVTRSNEMNAIATHGVIQPQEMVVQVEKKSLESRNK